MDINILQNEIIEEFETFDEWMDKYNYLIELSNSLPVISEEGKSQANLIEGCQSRVWLDASLTKERLVVYTADSDAIITKGIISLLIRVLSNREPKEIMDADLYFIDKIGLKEHLSPTRANGLLAMLKQMKLYAVAFNAKLNSNL